MTIMARFSLQLRIVGAIASASLTALSLFPTPTLAGDPFRSSNSGQIGNQTEAAFKAIFETGNYPQAKLYLQQAESSEPNEPLVYAMRASLAYTEQDWKSVNTYAEKTLKTAEQLTTTNPLRGNLYTAVGHFLQGAYNLSLVNNDPIKGGSQALNKLQEVFTYLDKAEKVGSDDAELNLLKGYMDLMMAVNLPFSNPKQAIERLEKAGPSYLAYRGIAVGHRDLKDYDKALEYVNRALAVTPNNPEVHYLKAQILVAKGKKQKDQSLFNEAKKDFNAALAKPDQLPKTLVAQMFYEQCKNQKSVDSKERDCDGMRDKIRDASGSWGPAKMPQLE
ncbi:tetratricopeptide repeat protein [Trichocoleus sp. FACHB-90]|nr:tetratricopeptide repeat protein [Trichocoleus sp. FACHB-90]